MSNKSAFIHQLFFIDSTVANSKTIIDSLPVGSIYYWLNNNSNGLQQIASILSDYSELTAIHIISHGASGSLQLGDSLITQDTLNDYRAALATIGSALTATGDLLLYGCDVAQGETGTNFIQQIATMTGADVAASIDLTGSTNQGGDWDLEVQTGIIEVTTQLNVAAYNSVLAIIQGTTAGDTLNGTTGNDTLIGGTGDDMLWGGAGADTYNISKNDGNDFINNEHTDTSIDTVNFINLLPTDITSVSRSLTNSDLILNYGTSQLTITQYFDVGWYYTNSDGSHTAIDYKVSQFKFSDGTVWSGDLNITLQGTVGDDLLYGAAGNDTLVGGTGNDTLCGGAGADTYNISKNDGNDVIDNIHTDSSIDTVNFINLLPSDITRVSRGLANSDLVFNYGTSQLTIKQYFDVGWYYTNSDGSCTQIDYKVSQFKFSDGTVWSWTGDPDMILQGTAGNDTLNGGTGNDTLNGGTGNDTLFGGAGADTYNSSKNDGHDVINNEHTDSSIDTINFTNLLPTDITSVSRGLTNYDLIFNYGTDQLTIKQYFDTGWYYTNPDGSYSTIDYTVRQFKFSDGTVWIGDPNMTLQGTAVSDTLDGGTGNDTINGGMGNDTLYGGMGDDILKGDGGNDYMDGGGGNDSYYVDSINDTILDSAGNDTVHISVNGYKVPVGIENVIYEQGARPLPYFINSLDSGLHWGAVGQAQSLNYSFATVADGTNGFALYTPEQQTAVRTALAKYSAAAGLTFTETTDSSNVQLRFFRDDLTSAGNGGASGYSGYPTASDVHIAASITDLTYSGFNLLLHEIGHALGMKHPFDAPALPPTEDNQDNTVMSYAGSFSNVDIKLFDKATVQYLYGVNPTARTTDDTYYIADRYIWDGAGLDTLSAAEQTQTVYLDLTAGSWIYAGAKTDSILAANQAFIGFGTVIENAIGGSGNDTLIGNSVNNRLSGGAGTDTAVFSGSYTDYQIDTIAGGLRVTDLRVGGDGVDELYDIELLQFSNTTVNANSNSNHAPVLTSPTAINYTDTAFDDSFATVTTSLVANDVDGNTLSYSITGGTNSSLTVSKTSTYGTLTVTKATGAYSFVANDAAIEALTQAASTSFTVTVSDALLTDSKTLTVNIAQNGVTESLANDSLTGTSGNDKFNGLAGADTMTGGLGSDIYTVDNIGDVVTETSTLATEIDTVNSSVSYTLSANVEKLTLTGTAAINATGNGLANTLTGNTGVNVLTGGLGNDTYVVGAGDTVIETSTLATEIDTVNSSITYMLGANVEKLTLTGTAAINGTGNGLANTLTGNTGVNVLTGGLGNDIYFISTGDTVVETSTLATEIDTVNSSITYTLGANVEKLTLTGTAAINGTGNGLANTLTGNTGINVLTGGLGNDTYVIGTGDTVVETSTLASEIDTVNSSITYTLSANVEKLTLTGTAAHTGTGNGLANTLLGNTGANVLLGNAGNDILNGGAGNDSLTGGIGADTFVFNTALTTTGIDSITDFNVVDDTIQLENAVFKALTVTGVLASNAFRVIGHDIILPAVINNDYRIVYNHDDGAVFYDADGDGAVAAIQIALIGVTTHPALTNADFVVI